MHRRLRRTAQRLRRAARQPRGPTTNPVKVMTWAPQGTKATNMPGMPAMAQAYARWVNAKGGVNGRRLQGPHLQRAQRHRARGALRPAARRRRAWSRSSARTASTAARSCPPWSVRASPTSADTASPSEEFSISAVLPGQRRSARAAGRERPPAGRRRLLARLAGPSGHHRRATSARAAQRRTRGRRAPAGHGHAAPEDATGLLAAGTQGTGQRERPRRGLRLAGRNGPLRRA